MGRNEFQAAKQSLKAMKTNTFSKNDDINITMGKIVKVLPEVSMAIMGIVMIFFIIIVLKPIMELYTGSFLFDAYGM